LLTCFDFRVNATVLGYVHVITQGDMERKVTHLICATKLTMKTALSLSVLLAVGSAFSPAPQTHRSVTQLEVSSRRDWILTSLVVGSTLVASAQEASADARQVWLTEPTEDFKANEAKAMEFKRGQLAIKAEFNKVLERFTSDSNTEDQLVTDLTDLRMLVKKTGGLPLGIKKEELVKIIRRKKAAGFWPVPVEYA
jgi:hypothetical protein